MAVVISDINTLTYNIDLCVGCGVCVDVCPHGVFRLDDRRASLVRSDACIECGACQRNCPTGAIKVDSGVGCAQALIRAALTGGDPTCGPSDDCCESSCCCS